MAGSTEAAETLLNIAKQHELNLSSYFTGYREGNLLHSAIHYKRFETTEFLLRYANQNGLNMRQILNAVDSSGMTALELACFRGFVDIAELLFEETLQDELSHLSNGGYNIVHHTAPGNIQMLEFVLSRLTDEQRKNMVNSFTTADPSNSPLTLACGYLNLDAVRALIEAGAKVNNAALKGAVNNLIVFINKPKDNFFIENPQFDKSDEEKEKAVKILKILEENGALIDKLPGDLKQQFAKALVKLAEELENKKDQKASSSAAELPDDSEKANIDEEGQDDVIPIAALDQQNHGEVVNLTGQLTEDHHIDHLLS